MSNNIYDQNDDDLLLRLSEGNKSAFDILYNKYWKQVYNAAFKRINDVDHAQDIAQDVFVQLWTRGTHSPIKNLPAYLMVAARNGVFKQMEKEGKYAALPDVADELESPFNSADTHMLHEEFLEAFAAVVQSLPNQQRIIFEMRFNDDLTSQEIADILNISPKTVRNQIGKALVTINKSLILVQIFVYLYQKSHY